MQMNKEELAEDFEQDSSEMSAADEIKKTGG